MAAGRRRDWRPQAGRWILDARWIYFFKKRMPIYSVNLIKRIHASSALVAVAEYFSGELSAMPEGCGLAGASGVCRIFFQVGWVPVVPEGCGCHIPVIWSGSWIFRRGRRLVPWRVLRRGAWR